MHFFAQVCARAYGEIEIKHGKNMYGESQFTKERAKCQFLPSCHYVLTIEEFISKTC